MVKDIDIPAGGGFLDYAPAPESTSILKLRDSYGLFIDGDFVDGHGTPFSTVSPATEKVIAEIATANERDVDLAVAVLVGLRQHVPGLALDLRGV